MQDIRDLLDSLPSPDTIPTRMAVNSATFEQLRIALEPTLDYQTPLNAIPVTIDATVPTGQARITFADGHEEVVPR